MQYKALGYAPYPSTQSQLLCALDIVSLFPMYVDSVFALDFTCEGMTAAFVTPDGVPEETAGFLWHDFLADRDRALDRLIALVTAKARMRGKPGAVALSLACELDASRSKIVRFPEAEWLNGCALPQILAEALQAPTIMERQAVILLLCDQIMLGLPDTSLAVGCYVDRHFETAIWHNGMPLLGRSGRAGSITHIPIQGREDSCFCGKLGCADLYGAGIRLRQMHTMIFPDLPFDDFFTDLGDHPIIQDYLRMMAYPIAVEVNILDPDFVVLGGSIPSMRAFPRSMLEREIRDQLYHSGDTTGPILLVSVASELPGVVSAAQYARMTLGSSK